MGGGRKGKRSERSVEDVAAPSNKPGPWTLRYAARILTEDIGEIGHAAFAIARKAIQKKLPVDPFRYGDGLRPPLGGIYKLKASHVRVAYHIDEASHEVWILMIADRKVIWDRHEDDILARLGVMREEMRREKQSNAAEHR